MMEDALRPRNFITSLRASLKATFSPATAQLLEEAVKSEPDFSVMASILKLDPALATAILSLVNSPFYGQAGRISDLQRAAVILGNTELLRIALSLSLQSNLNTILEKNGFDTYSNWRIIVWAALGAELVAERIAPQDKDAAYICALVKDLSLLLYAATFPDHILPNLNRQDFINTGPDFQSWSRYLPEDHSALTAELLEEWNFPPHMVEAISAHHDLGRVMEYPPLTQAVILGTRWAEVEFRADPTPETLGQLKLYLAKTDALPEDGLNGIRTACATRFAHLCSAMNIRELPPEERLYSHPLQTVQDIHYQALEIESMTGGSYAIAAGIARHLRWNWEITKAAIILKNAAGTHWIRYQVDQGTLSEPTRGTDLPSLRTGTGFVLPLEASEIIVGELRVIDTHLSTRDRSELTLYSRLLAKSCWRQMHTVGQLEIKADLLDTLPAGVALADDKGFIVRANPVFADFLDVQQDLHGVSLMTLLNHAAYARIHEGLRRFLTSPDMRSHCSVHCPLMPGSGPESVCFALSCYRLDPDGPPGILVMLQNLTEIRILETEALQQHEFLSNLLTTMQDLVLTMDKNGLISFASGPLAPQLTGRNLFAITQPTSMLTEPWTMEILDHLDRAIEVTLDLPDGAQQLELIFSRFNHGTNHALVVGRNISVIRRLERKIKEQALFDSLTQVFNRHHLQPLLEREIARSRRSDTQIGAIFFDCDKFKVFNDTYGHHTGDQALKDIGRILRGLLRKGLDYPCRFGGDEFVVVCSQVTADSLHAICERIRNEFKALHEDTVTLSIGCSLLEPDDSPQSLLERSDKANYQAKAQGGNTIVRLQSNPQP